MHDGLRFRTDLVANRAFHLGCQFMRLLDSEVRVNTVTWASTQLRLPEECTRRLCAVMAPGAFTIAASNALGSTSVAASVSTSDAWQKISKAASATMRATTRETAASAPCKPFYSPISPRMTTAETSTSEPVRRASALGRSL